MSRGRIGSLTLPAAAVMAAILMPVSAGEIALQWDSVPGATGYRVYYGTSSGQYTDSTTVGNTTSATVSGLADCTEWYLAVKAYNSVGESPTFSEEVVGWARPRVDLPGPAAAIQGAQFTLNIPGMNFQPGATVQIEEPNVFLSSAAVLSCNQMQVAATIEPTAPGVRAAEVGRYTLTVVNPDDVFGARAQAFEIQVAPERFDVDRRQGPSQGRLDGRDTIKISRVFASREGDPLYDPDSDFNGDGWVDGTDLAYLASNLGRCWNGAAWSVSACPESLR